jgi:hypothetical protein
VADDTLVISESKCLIFEFFIKIKSPEFFLDSRGLSKQLRRRFEEFSQRFRLSLAGSALTIDHIRNTSRDPKTGARSACRISWLWRLKTEKISICSDEVRLVVKTRLIEVALPVLRLAVGYGHRSHLKVNL